MNDPRILVDQEDAWLLEQYKWTVTRSKGDRTEYAVRFIEPDGKRQKLHLHRIILGASDDAQVDHINGNGLDNRRENLRLANTSQNKANVGLMATNTSGRKGVTWNQQRGKWCAQITVGGRSLNLGRFTDLDEAARAYDKAAVEFFGEYALTNEMLGLCSQQNHPEDNT